MDTAIKNLGGTKFKADSSSKKFVTKNYFESDTTIEPEIAKKILGFDDDKAMLSVSRLEHYNRCPYSYLSESCFRLKARDEFGIDARDTGELQHAILENAFKTINVKSELTYDDCGKLVDDVFYKSLGDLVELFSASERNSYIASHLKNITKKEVKIG